jgi:hypothetical protein
MKNLKFLIPFIAVLFFVSCSDDCDDCTTVNVVDNGVAPSTYSFARGGQSTVSYSGQTTRLMQANEIYKALNSDDGDGTPRDFTEEELNLMFAGNSIDESGGFFNTELNGTTKLIRSKTSGSAYSATNRTIFDDWIADFVNEVTPNLGVVASPGVAGILGGYQLNAAGQEIDQLFFKSLIGAFTLDQIINNYITPVQLDSGQRREDNTNGDLFQDKNYTEMEHKWDEGFGYLYGEIDDVLVNYGVPADGEGSGNLLMKYFDKVNDPGEGGDIAQDPLIAETVYNAFIAGRHAITMADYEARDAAATIIKVELSKVIGMYAKYYLNSYLSNLNQGNVAKAHHSLSEAFGFIFSLQFTDDGSDNPYMSHDDVMHILFGNGAPGPAGGGYLADFHNINSDYITAPGSGIISVIDTAFGFN